MSFNATAERIYGYVARKMVGMDEAILQEGDKSLDSDEVAKR